MPPLQPEQIIIGNKYIITKIKDGVRLEQHVNIDKKTTGGDGSIIYGFYYGVFGYHEGFTPIGNIRCMTDEEQANSDTGKYYNLPQQFYQSPFDSTESNTAQQLLQPAVSTN